MISCKECKSWDRLSEEESRFGTCFHKSFIYDRIPRESYPSNAFLYWDHEGYCAGFYTGEDFGCVHGEKA